MRDVQSGLYELIKPTAKLMRPFINTALEI